MSEVGLTLPVEQEFEHERETFISNYGTLRVQAAREAGRAHFPSPACVRSALGGQRRRRGDFFLQEVHTDPDGHLTPSPTIRELDTRTHSYHTRFARVGWVSFQIHYK